MWSLTAARDHYQQAQDCKREAADPVVQTARRARPQLLPEEQRQVAGHGLQQ